MARQPSFTAALRIALRALGDQPLDAAAVRLAQKYATELDGDGDLVKLGPQLLTCLTALGMTPAARAAKGAVREQPPANALDELRQRRATRQRHAPAVHATAP